MLFEIISLLLFTIIVHLYLLLLKTQKQLPPPLEPRPRSPTPDDLPSLGLGEDSNDWSAWGIQEPPADTPPPVTTIPHRFRQA